MVRYRSCETVREHSVDVDTVKVQTGSTQKLQEVNSVLRVF